MGGTNLTNFYSVPDVRNGIGKAVNEELLQFPFSFPVDFLVQVHPEHAISQLCNVQNRTTLGVVPRICQIVVAQQAIRVFEITRLDRFPLGIVAIAAFTEPPPIIEAEFTRVTPDTDVGLTN